jgi:hypothetical protein
MTLVDDPAFALGFVRLVTDAVVRLPGKIYLHIDCCFLYYSNNEVVLFYSSILYLEVRFSFEIELSYYWYALPIVHPFCKYIFLGILVTSKERVFLVDSYDLFFGLYSLGQRRWRFKSIFVIGRPATSHYIYK